MYATFAQTIIPMQTVRLIVIFAITSASAMNAFDYPTGDGVRSAIKKITAIISKRRKSDKHTV